MKRTAIALLLALDACAAPIQRPEPTSAPSETLALPLSTDDIEGNFLLRQRLHYRWREQSGSLDAVVQNTCGELTVVMLTPFGTRAAWARQRGSNVEGESGPMPLPFGPERVLLDVQRSHLVPVVAPVDGASQTTKRIGEQRLEESWRDGLLVERVFEDTRGGRLRVRYPTGVRPGEIPSVAELEATPAGYTLDVETVARSELECDR